MANKIYSRYLQLYKNASMHIFICIVGVRVAQSKGKRTQRNIFKKIYFVRSGHPGYLWTKRRINFSQKLLKMGVKSFIVLRLTVTRSLAKKIVNPEFAAFHQS